MVVALAEGSIPRGLRDGLDGGSIGGPDTRTFASHVGVLT